MDYDPAPKQKIIVEVGRIDKTFKQFHKYLRLDKKSPEFDKAFYENVKKNKELNFVLSNAASGISSTIRFTGEELVGFPGKDHN